ncbi:MAG TPA: Ig-like domain-containing protein [Pedomonas sp.]|uniref:Ig-like domain-containing protein n=1 Tax=Pedomonas sp. TaxID=2976421 RepID=UPI002F419CB5
MAKKSRSRSSAELPAAKDKQGQERQPRFMMLALEQRFMFDGAAAATAAADVSTGSGDTGWHDTGRDVAPDAAVEPVPPVMQAAPRDRTEIVFVDKRVPDYQALIDAVNPGAEIILLGGDQDGVAQMAQALGGRSDVDAIHIISHGGNGVLHLGKGSLNAANMDAQSEALATIGKALTQEGDIQLWGCDVGADAKGMEFLNKLAALTGADIAASTDSTGAERLGGNWALEAYSGDIAVSTALDIDRLNETYDYLLSIPDGTQTFIGISISNNVGITADGYFRLTRFDGSGGNSNLSADGFGAYIADSNPASSSYISYLEVTVASTGSFNITTATIGEYDDSSDASFTDVYVVGFANGEIVAKTTPIDDGPGVNPEYPIDYTPFQDVLIDTFRIYYTVSVGTSQTAFNLVDFTVSGATTDPVPPANTAPTATNLTQHLRGNPVGAYSRTELGDIVVTDPDSDEVVTATLTMSNPAAGSLSTGTHGSATSTFNPGTGVWAVTGSVADVNAALAEVAFVMAGSWTGDVFITTQVVDSAGASAGNGEIHLDFTPPAAPSTPDLVAGSDSGSSPTDNLTNDTTPTFTGTAEANSTVTLYDGNGNARGSVLADSTGNWSITTSALSEGSHSIVVRAVDEVGNESAISAATVITIDTTGPVVSPPNMQAESDSGSSNTDNLTNVVRPGFSGTAEAGAIIQLFIDNAGNGDPSDPLNWHLGNAIANQSGEWSITPTSDLPEGNWTIKARGRDAAGNFGIASPGLSVTIDTTPPAAPSTPDLSAASDTGISNADNITNDTNPTFTGTAGAGSTVELFNDANGNGVVDAGESLGTATANGAGVWSITATLGNGVHFIKAAARDAAGNASASSALSLHVDTTAPAAPSIPDLTAGSDTGLSDTDNLTNDATPTFSGTAEAYAQMEIYANGTLIGTTTAASDGSWQFTATALGNGTYNITARAIDNAGNVSAQSAPLAITIDTTAPTLDTAASAPAANAVGVDPDSDISLRFDELAIMPASGGFITLYNVTDGAVFETIAFASPAISGWGTDTIVISPSTSLPLGKTIAVRWDGTVFSDTAGNVAAANTSDSFYAFTVRANPLLTGGGTVSWTEGGAPVVIAPALSVTDIDSTNVAGATVQISDVRVGDTLALGVPGPFTASYDAATGLLTLTGPGTLAEMQAALRSITYSSSSDAPSGGGATPTRAITFTVFDESSGGASNSVTTAVTVVDVNDAPVLADTDLTLDPVVEDGGAPVNGVASGTLVSELVGGISDADLTLPRGIAIVGADASHGTWWFTTNGGASWSALGTPAEAAARLLAADANTRLHFAPNANWNGVLPAALTIRAWDMSAGSNGGMANISAIGTGGTVPFSTATDTVSLSVEAVNDAPVIAAPLQIGVVEDVTTPLTGISFTDVDAGSAPVTVTLSVGSGTLAATSGGGVVVGGTGQSLTLTGSLADLNAYLAGGNAAYTTARDSTASQTLTVSISDNGNTGSGGALTDHTTVQLNVTAVNDAPVITAPASISLTEDVASPLTGITISDVDAGSGMMTVTLSVPAGALSAINAFSVSVGTTIDARTLTLTGSQANLNTYLASGLVSYTPAANDSGTRILTVSVTDNGNSGSGGAQTDSTTVALAIAAVNDAPTITAPAQIGVTEDLASPLTGISVADVDAGTNPITVTLSVPAGSLLATSGGGVVVGGTGQSLTLTGSVADLNAYLAGGNATYITARDSTASQTLTISVNDNGNTGAGGALTDHTTVQLNVTAVNDAPVITPGGGTAVYTEGSVPVALDAGLTLSDIDSPTLASATVAITGNFHAGQDLLAFVNDGTTMGNITGSYNAATGVLTLTSAGGTATLAQWQAALRTVGYANTAGAPEAASRTVSIVVSDGSASSAASTRAVSIVLLNDAPVLADTNLTLDPIAEDGGAPVAGVASGTLVSELVGGISDADLTLARGIAIVGADTSHGTWWFTTDGGASWSMLGTPGESTARLLAADANTRVHFEPNANWNGTLAAALTIRAWDQSAGSNGGMADITASGTGGTSAFSAATDTVSLSVEAVNDAPVVTAPVLIGVIEDVASPLTGIVIADVDAGNAPISVTLTVGSGTLAASSGSGVVVAGAGQSLTLTGNLADLNAYLASASVTYTTARDSTASQTLTVAVTDNGNTGTGGAKTGQTTIQLDVTSVNDAPTADGLTRTVPFVEDGGPVGLGGIVVRDVDAGETVTATLTLSDPKAGVLSTGTFGSATARFDAMTGVWSVSGSVVDVNAALAALTFTPAANRDQSVQLAVSIRDSAGTGPDGTLTLEASPVNDAPTAGGLTRTVPFVEDGDPVGLGSIVVRDVDAGETVTATLTLSDPKAGVLSTGTFGSATARFDVMTGVWSVSGSVADVNAALAALTFTPAANRDQSVQLAVSIRDSAGTGPDGTLTLEATPVNDAPVLTAPEAITVTEDVASPLTGIVIADVDAGNAPISVTLTVGSGTLAASSGSGVVIGGAGQSLTLTGNLADLNAYLASGSVTYTTARDSTASQTLTVEVTDNGNTGAGGAKTGQTTIQLDVAPVNDAPVSTGPLPDVIWRGGDNSLALPGDAFADADAGDTLHYGAALADGTPLPSWLRFDAGSLTLSGRPPEGVGALTLVITATDQQGATAAVSFTLSYDNPAEPVPQPPAPPVHVPPAAAPAPPSEAPAPSSQVSGSGIGAPRAPILTVISGAPQGSLFGSPSDRDGRNALAPAWESEPRLSALQPVLDARVLDGPFVFALPLDMFLHRDPAAVLRLEARLADGSPLPDWLTFDPQTATFKGTPPPGAGTVTVEIVARDLNGQQTTATLKLQPGQAEAAAETPTDAADAPADADRPAEGEARAASREGAETAEARLPGKPSFSQQLALARQGGLAAQHAALIEAAQVVARETRS